jgi:hypothetical protein
VVFSLSTVVPVVMVVLEVVMEGEVVRKVVEEEVVVVTIMAMEHMEDLQIQEEVDNQQTQQHLQELPLLQQLHIQSP